MSKLNPKPKGQQPVDVISLQKRKMEYKLHISHPDWSLKSIRKRRFKDIIHWNGGIPSILGFSGFYGWLQWFCGRESGSRGDWFHREAVQPMRDMYKMIPSCIDYHYLSFDNIDRETVVFIKKSSKRKDYMDEKQWKDIVDFIRDHNTNKLIKKIFFCVYDDENPVKIRDKEWKFIEDTGCKCIGDWSSHIHITGEYKQLLKGKLFKIKY